MAVTSFHTIDGKCGF